MDQGVDHLLDIAIHKGRRVVHVFADSVVGDAALGEVVGSNLFGSIAGADLGTPVGGLGLFGFEAFGFLQFGR